MKVVDLIFVDINMPDLNGVDFVRALIDRPMVIFTTAYSEYAVEGSKPTPWTTCSNPSSFCRLQPLGGWKANSLYELRHNQRAAGGGTPRAAAQRQGSMSP